MNKISRFDKTNCKELRKVIDETLQNIAKEYGISIKTSAGSFTESDYSFKVEACTIDTNGIAHSKEASEFRAFASSYGLNADDLDKTFLFKDEVYKIKGLSTRSSKFPIIAKNLSNNRIFKFPEDLVCKILEGKS